MAPSNFEPCCECGVSTHDECEICNEPVCKYCVEDHQEVHEETDDDE
jgi:hypothetical protein